jgi:hypothetical protein
MSEAYPVSGLDAEFFEELPLGSCKWQLSCIDRASREIDIISTESILVFFYEIHVVLIIES